MKTKDKFKVMTRRSPGGGYDWTVYRWDAALGRALGEASGWVRVPRAVGHVGLRSEAGGQARAAMEEWLWAEANPEEVDEIIEIEREL